MDNSTLSEPLRRFVVRMAWASLVPIGMLLLAMALKPMWRDEFWSFYFSEPRFSMFELWGDRMRYESHPPLYFTLLRLWRGIADTELWIRALAVPIVLVGALGAYLIGRGRREIGLYLLVCVGSYWLIYFATEARPYLLLFMLSAWLTLIAAKLLDNPNASPLWYLLWIVVGAAIGLTHYPAAVWLGCIGLAVGIGFLAQRRPGAFFAIGIASAIALAPVLYWLLALSVPLIGHGGGLGAPGADQWQSFLTQFSRGLTVKLLGSNLAITCLVFAGIVALWRSKSVLDRVIVGSALLFVAATAALDLFYAPMMRERSFMAMIPSLLLLMTRAVLSVDPERPWARRFLVAAPIVAAISPFLFIPEYFKDREKLGELRAYVASEAGDCAGSPVVAFMRGSWGHDIYPREVIDRQMRMAVPGRQPLILAPREVTGALSHNPGCRLRGIALTLRPGYREHHDAALAALREAGLDPNRLEELRFGKGRNMLWVEPAEDSPQAAQQAGE